MTRPPAPRRSPAENIPFAAACAVGQDRNCLMFPQRWRIGVTADLSPGLIRERELEGHPILRAHHFRDVTLASGVFDKGNGSRPDGNLFSSGNFDFSPAAQRNYVLSTWGAMPIVNATASCCLMELRPSDLRHFGDFGRAAGGELQFYFFGMRLIV